MSEKNRATEFTICLDVTPPSKLGEKVLLDNYMEELFTILPRELGCAVGLVYLMENRFSRIPNESHYLYIDIETEMESSGIKVKKSANDAIKNAKYVGVLSMVRVSARDKE